MFSFHFNKLFTLLCVSLLFSTRYLCDNFCEVLNCDFLKTFFLILDLWCINTFNFCVYFHAFYIFVLFAFFYKAFYLQILLSVMLFMSSSFVMYETVFKLMRIFYKCAEKNINLYQELNANALYRDFFENYKCKTKVSEKINILTNNFDIFSVLKLLYIWLKLLWK